MAMRPRAHLFGLSVALIAAALALVSGAAQACAPDPSEVRQWAFAKLSPVPVFAAPGDRNPSGAAHARFAEAYPIIARKGRREIEVCIDGKAVWSRKSNFMTTHERLWIETGKGMRITDRPRLEFWESPDRLRVYIGGETEIAQPDYREFSANAVTRKVSFPVIRVDFVKMQVGNRDVEVANVLVPFPREAVEAYQAIRDPGDGGGVAPGGVLGLVVDISGSTEGLVAGPIRDLAEGLASHAHLARVRVVSAGFGGDGGTITRKDRSIDDPGLAKWPVKPAPGGGHGDHDIASAIGFVARNTADDVPLIVLSGGDVGLARARLAKFSSVTIGQITPEIETALKSSARRDGLDFLDFDRDLGARLAERIARLMPPPPGVQTKEAAFAIVGELMEAAGMLPILPHDLEVRERMAIPPAGRTNVAWFATELFLAVRDDLLTYREE